MHYSDRVPRVETFASASSLGAIGIWCMHFIGNRAIILDEGSSSIQLVYSHKFTIISAFLPIIGLCAAFGAAEYPTKSSTVHWTLLTCTGVFAGLSIVGMHYLANCGVSNYKLEYVPRFVVASVIIAVGDCLTVLMIFYTWREKWISVWWKRVVCAILLAGGVSAMHFTASANCIYHFKHYNAPEAIRSRNVQIVAAGTLGGTAGIAFICLTLFNLHRSRVLKKSSQKVMLACAMFDPDGRILVTTEGVLPSREITDKYNHHTFNEEFDTAHPVFQWIFRVSRNWAGVVDLIPKMKHHIGAYRANSEEDSRPTSSASSAHYDPDTYNDYSIVFRERFCTAAASLASSMNIDVRAIGVLFDQIIETGTLEEEDNAWRRNTFSGFRSRDDIEMAVRQNAFGKGQLLFLTKQLDSDMTYNLLDNGFRFASVQQVEHNIAEAMQIPPSALEMHMSSLKHYVDNLGISEKSGTRLSIFAMIPKVNSGKGFDIAVKKSEENELPDVQLLTSEPLQWQATFLERMHEMSSDDCMAFLGDKQHTDTIRTPAEHEFAQSVLQAMVRLSEQVPSSWFTDARFYGKALHAHYSQPLHDGAPVTTLFSLVVCADLHTAIEPFMSISQVPLSFFSVRQQCYAGSPNHAITTRDIHQEFAPLLARKTPKATATERVKKISIHIPTPGHMKLTKNQSRRPSMIRASSDDNLDSASDTYELVDKPRHSSKTERELSVVDDRRGALGGILVNSDTVVKFDDKSAFNNDSKTQGLGVQTAVSTSKPEETFVDELIAFARAMIPSKPGY